MTNHQILATETIFCAINDVVQRTSMYSAPTGNVEIEQLFLLDASLTHFVQMIGEMPGFSKGKPIFQQDEFFDLRLDRRWMLSDTDHYIRLREQRSPEGGFASAELKVGYPGSLSNKNVRPAVDHALHESGVSKWHHILGELGFEIERRYKKHRVPFLTATEVAESVVELECDVFVDAEHNGPLAGRSFVSLSVEATGDRRPDVERALAVTLAQLRSATTLIECDGNYESYFYRHLDLPSAASTK